MKFDWPTIKKEYVQGISTETGVIYPTYEELAKRHKVSAGYLRAKAGKEDWSGQKTLYLAKIEQKKIENRTEKLAGQQADFDFEIFKIAKNLLAYVKARMNKLNKKLAADEEYVVSISELDQLSRVTRQIQDIGKRALGEESGDDEIEIVVDVV